MIENIRKGNDMKNNDELAVDSSKPITKDDIEKNPISEAFQDMMRRFDLLDEKKNKKEIF